MHSPQTPPGLDISWRPASLDDAAELSDLFNAVSSFDETPERLSEESMAHELKAYFDPLTDRTVVGKNATGDAVAYGTVFHRSTEGSEQRVYVNAFVLPAHRDVGIEDAITDWAIAVGTEVLRAQQGAKKYLASWFYKKQEEVADRFAARDFAAVRYWWDMERDLTFPIAEAPEDGFEVVPWKPDHAEPARLVYNTAFADHWGSSPMDSETWTRLVVGSPNFRKEFSFVAVASGEVVGYSANESYPEDWEAAGRREGWVGGLGVVRDWRKKGIATALLSRSMAAMHDEGLDAAMIGVDAASPTGAQHLYQSVGFATKITATTWQREVS